MTQRDELTYRPKILTLAQRLSAEANMGRQAEAEANKEIEELKSTLSSAIMRHGKI